MGGWTAGPVIQFGTVSATQPEALQATVAGGTHSVDVAVPAGAQSLVILDPSGDGTNPRVTGDQSGNVYIVIQTTVGTARWISSIDPAKDTSATVNFSGTAPSAQWYVMASIAPSPLVFMASEALGGTSVGLSPMTNLGAFLDESGIQRPATGTDQGALYVVGAAPSVTASQHPPVELSYAALDNTSAGGTLIPAPSAGLRIRVLFAELAVVGGSAGGGVVLSPAGGGLGTLRLRVSVGFALSREFNGYPSGLPLAAATAVTTAVTGTVTYSAQATYTVETV